MNKNFFILSLTILCSIQAYAQKYESPIYIVKGVAIDGYDVVAYFDQNEAVKGNQEFATDWKNVTWFFASSQNLENFKADPSKYAPQYGGYCAWGMGQGYKAKIDPKDSWTIVDNKLYINYNKEVKEMWLPEKEALIKKANENWKQFDN